MLNDDEKAKIDELAAKNYPVRQIAKEVGRDPKTVRKYIGTMAENEGNSEEENDTAPPAETQVEGDLAGRVFARLNKGESPEVIVEMEKISPAIVAELFNKWRELKNLAKASDLVSEIKRLQNLVNQLVTKVSSLSTRLANVEKGAGQTPVWGMDTFFTCPCCGSQGAPKVPVQCGVCGFITTWGNQ